MFDFDAGKIVVIGVVALVVIGPKELPRVLRQVGQMVGKMRRMAADFQSQFMDAMREAEIADVKEEMSKIAESAKLDVAFDPVRDIKNQISSAIDGDTTPKAVEAAAPLAALPDATVDLSDAASLPSPAPDPIALEKGIVAESIAPISGDADPDADGRAPTAAATLDDVRKALDETLGESRAATEDGLPHPADKPHPAETPHLADRPRAEFPA